MGRRFICVGLALLLSLPAAAQEEGLISRGGFVELLWQWAGSVPAAVSESFSDVDRNSRWAGAVAWAEDMGLVEGDGQGHFFPDEPLTHAQLELILSRYDAVWGRPDGFYLPGAWPGDPVTMQDGEKAVEQFYRGGGAAVQNSSTSPP